MTDSNALKIVTAIGGFLVLLAILAGVFVLAWHNTISGAEALGIVTVIITGVGVGGAVHVGVKAGVSAAQDAPPNPGP